MIFGKTLTEARKEFERRMTTLEEWHRYYVWWPMRMNDGRYVWLHSIWRRAHIWRGPYVSRFEFSGWEYSISYPIEGNDETTF